MHLNQHVVAIVGEDLILAKFQILEFEHSICIAENNSHHRAIDFAAHPLQIDFVVGQGAVRWVP